MTPSRYCVIGAGAAGVSALQQLRQAGYHVECFERSDRVGGHWHTDYEALHLITFDTEIVSVSPEPSGQGPVGSAGWRVISSRGDEGTFDGVVVANGHLWDPYLPPVPGEYTGRQLHSGEYRNVADLDGDRVLVVGAGNSGCDLAVDVAQHR